MVGGTSSESAIYLAPDDAVWNRTLSEEELQKRTAAVAGEATDDLLAYYKRRDPAATPADRLIFELTAMNFQVRSTLLAERKAAHGKAAVWMYRFDWETPAFGGRLKSPHSMDVPFVFDTLGAISRVHGKPGAQDLADTVSATWASFARKGDPSNKSIPAWPAYGTANNDKRTTMIFNDECKVVADPDGEVRPLWSKLATS
jgi:para-nitrobenzyl esterase